MTKKSLAFQPQPVEYWRFRMGSHLRANEVKEVKEPVVKKACSCVVLNDLWGTEIRSMKELFFNQGEGGLASKGLLWHLRTDLMRFACFQQLSIGPGETQRELIAQESLIAPICFCSCLACPQTDLRNTMLLLCHHCSAHMA